jgi:prepilin-type N-terminal cleavage/methylation domain-containing protein/prepilin-type processing-associated H-X9-DG protein
LPRRKRGFTLIELLVVIAIIGILAAMLFPVFARAREAARKIQCLANVKNISMAVMMYLVDWDKFWPTEHRQEVHDFWNTSPGSKDIWDPPECGDRADLMSYRANPYLRPVVLLDEYIKNRDVWRCPSAKMETGCLRVVPGPDWFSKVVANASMLNNGICLKDDVYPPGWGGTITDSFLQGECTVGIWDEAWGGGAGGGQSSFTQSIGLNGYSLIEVNPSSLDDPSKTVVCGDLGMWSEGMNPGILAYPDLCNPECGNCWCSSWIEDCYDSIADGCPDAITCFETWHTSSAMLKNKELLKKGSRHLGGTNIGFSDGHAKWMASASFLDIWAEEAKANGGWPYAMGLWAWGPYSFWQCSGTDTFGELSGEPTLR